MKKQKGFSLIELLIVVAIILIIAAIAIPNLLRSRMAANESSAVGSLRTLNTSEVAYSTTYPSVGFTTLSALGGAAPCTAAVSTASCLVDAVLAPSSGNGVKSGYSFTITPGTTVPAVTYSSLGTPLVLGQSGQRTFCSDQSGVIRANATSGACTTADAPI